MGAMNSVAPGERVAKVREWLSTLEHDYSIDTDVHFASTHESIALLATVRDYSVRQRAESELALLTVPMESQLEATHRVAKLMLGAVPGTYVEFVDEAAAVTAVRRRADYFEPIAAVIALVAAGIESRIVESFRAEGAETLLDLLRPRHTEVTERMIALAAVLPPALRTPLDAASLGLAAEREELSRLAVELDYLHASVSDCRREGVVAAAGSRRASEYQSVEFQYLDPTAYFTVERKQMWRPMRIAHALAAGTPALLSVDEVDALRTSYEESGPTRDEHHEGLAAWDAHRAALAAALAIA